MVYCTAAVRAPPGASFHREMMMNWLARLIVESAETEYSRAMKSVFTGWGFILFELVVPAAFLVLGITLEKSTGIGALLHLHTEFGMGARLAFFLPLLALSQLFVIWTAVHQLRFSGGTPAFKAPPRRLLTSGPFRYCRNPMVFGYLLYYYGLALLFACPTALFGLIPALNLLALYVIIEGEEVELEERFGNDYLAYKASVNRMIPVPPRWRPWLRSHKPGARRRLEHLDDEGQRA
ncbi:MAG: methyltransferase family protein [Acidobacteriota bacterium]